MATRLFLCWILLGIVCAYGGTTHQVPETFSTIQAAIDVAVDGDTVLVSPGTYGPITFAGKSIVVQSLDPYDPDIVAQTVIEAVLPARTRGSVEGNRIGSAVLFQGSETEKAILSGFTIVGGSGTLSDVIEEGQDFNIGGSIAIINASPTITHNVIINPTIPPENDSSVPLLGGGIGCVNSNALITSNTIQDCAATNGGGLFCWGGTIRIANNLIVKNTALAGGGVFLIGGHLINNTLAHNEATDPEEFSGGNLVLISLGLEQDCTVRNNIICQAVSGGGAYIQLQENEVDFAYNNVWGNIPVDYQLRIISMESMEVKEGGPRTLTGLYDNISQNPLFVASQSGDYHLLPDSPCINTGDPGSSFPWNRVDMDGDPRIISGITDMGMDEFPYCIKPVAQAGPDQYLTNLQLVQLDGSQSFFCDPCALRQFLWTQITGPQVELDDPTSIRPVFTPTQRGDYGFTLEVQDSNGLISSDDILVTIINHPPLAHTGPNIKILELPQVVQLDGSESQDPDGDPLTYQWDQTRGPQVVLSDPCARQPEFVPLELGTYGFSLTVSDGILQSIPVEVLVTLGNRTPTAQIQGPRACSLGQIVTLDGSLSSDPDPADTLTYQWTQLDGLPVDLVHADLVITTFTCPTAGSYRFELTVHDGVDTSPPVFLTITAIELVQQQLSIPVDFTTDKYFHYPDVSGQTVAYGVGSACDFTWSIQVNDLISQTVTEYSGGGIDTQPKLDGHRMVWFGGPRWNDPWTHEPSCTSIFAADLSAKEKVTLRPYSMSESYSHPVISGTRVVWLEHTGLDPRPTDSGDANRWWNTPYNVCGADITDLSHPVYFTIAQDVGTRDPYPCYTYSSDFDDVIDICGDLVVWEAQGDIFGADISDSNNITPFVICSDPARQCDPAISGSTVVWTDQRHDQGDIYGADISDLSNIRIAPLVRKASRQSQPALDKYLLAYVEGQTTGPIHLCCLTPALDCLEIQVEQEIYGCGPAVAGSTVVWQDQTYGRAQGLQAQVHYTVPDGPVANITLNTFYDSIQMAIDAAEIGDEIVLSAGTYTSDITLDKGIILRSVNPQDPDCISQTIISGHARAVTIYGNDGAVSQLSGLTLTDAQVGIACYSGAPLITDCIVTGHTGDGVQIMETSFPVLSRCHIKNNQGHGLIQQGKSNPRESRSDSASSFVFIDNCLISGNRQSGIKGNMISLQNGTVVENRETGIAVNRLECANSIIYFNGINRGEQITAYQSEINYCLIQGAWPSPSVMDADPGFLVPGSWVESTPETESGKVDYIWLEGDYHLMPGSPGIDAGDPNRAPNDEEYDLDGMPRLMGDAIDLGAYESY